MPHLLGMLPDAIAAHLRGKGIEVRDDEARRTLAHAFWPRDAEKRPLSKALREQVAGSFDGSRLEIVERAEDPSDGFVKYLFRSPDGALHEAVRIPLEKHGRFTVCLSSQVGCAMRCAFCATGRLGLARNLETWEMVAALLAVRDEAPGRVTGVAFMGQGEPFHNYENVIAAARVLSHPCGGRISADAITISTVGLVPQIRRFAREGHDYKLIVSLTSAIAERRASLLPVMGERYTLEEIAAAIGEYGESASTRVTIAWVLMGGVNDGADEAAALARFQELAGVPLRLNLIDVNVHGVAANDAGFRRATDEERNAFVDALQPLKIPIVRRYSGGRERHAACGMLAATAFR